MLGYNTYYEKSERIFYANALMDNGANVLYETPKGQTALHYARLSNNSDLLKRIMKQGVDINSQNKKGQSPFFYIVYTSSSTSPRVEKALRTFKILGADINLQEVDDMTPLMEAVWYEREDLVRVLIDLGVDLEVRNFFGSALAWTVVKDHNNIEIAKMLLDKGVTTKMQSTSSSIIYMASSYDMKRLILSYNKGHYQYYDADKEKAYYQCVRKLKSENHSHAGAEFYVNYCWDKVYKTPDRHFSFGHRK